MERELRNLVARQDWIAELIRDLESRKKGVEESLKRAQARQEPIEEAVGMLELGLVWKLIRDAEKYLAEIEKTVVQMYALRYEEEP